MAAASQGMLGGARRWKGRGTDVPLCPQKEPGPASTLILDFWSPELWENKFLLFQAGCRRNSGGPVGVWQGLGI